MRIVPETTSVRITDVSLPALPAVLRIAIVVSTKSASMVTASILVTLPMLVEPMLNVPFSITEKPVLVRLNSLATLKLNAFVFPMLAYRTLSVHPG